MISHPSWKYASLEGIPEKCHMKNVQQRRALSGFCDRNEHMATLLIDMWNRVKSYWGGSHKTAVSQEVCKSRKIASFYSWFATYQIDATEEMHQKDAESDFWSPGSSLESHVLGDSTTTAAAASLTRQGLSPLPQRVGSWLSVPWALDSWWLWNSPGRSFQPLRSVTHSQMTFISTL